LAAWWCTPAGRAPAPGPAWTAQSLAADFAAARDRLELIHAENLSVADAFNLSYRELAVQPWGERAFRAVLLG
jgi:hypothetical protein